MNKIRTIDENTDIVRVAMQRLGTYTPSLDMQIHSLASAMRNLDLANRDIDQLETTTVFEITRYGQKMMPHPVFRVAKESQELICRQAKMLGLTTKDLATLAPAEDDPLQDLTKELIAVRDVGEIVHPGGGGDNE